MKNFIALILFVFILSACGPSPEQVQKAIEETQQADQKTQVAGIVASTQNAPTATATKTKAPTRTPVPTKTPKPSATPTATQSMVETREKLVESIKNAMSLHPDIESVNMVRITDGVLEIELKTKWASRDMQPDVNYSIAKDLAGIFGKYPKSYNEEVMGGPFLLRLVIYSTDGDYRYQSETNYELAVSLAKQSVSFDEWVQASGAGFK